MKHPLFEEKRELLQAGNAFLGGTKSAYIN